MVVMRAHGRAQCGGEAEVRDYAMARGGGGATDVSTGELTSTPSVLLRSEPHPSCMATSCLSVTPPCFTSTAPTACPLLPPAPRFTSQVLQQ